jgi:hypothetical protein
MGRQHRSPITVRHSIPSQRSKKREREKERATPTLRHLHALIAIVKESNEKSRRRSRANCLEKKKDHYEVRMETNTKKKKVGQV